MRIAIIGAGAIGQAIAGLIAGKKRVTVEFWDKDETKVPQQRLLAEVIQSADVVFLCVPSFAIRPVLEAIIPHLPSKAGVVSLAKGIERGTDKTVNEIFQELLPAGHQFGLLNGPMLAVEIVQGLPAAAVVGSSSRRLFNRLNKLFAGTALCVEYSRDVHGIALASVLKNIYAIGAGIGEGLGYGDNFRGWFLAAAAREMATILKSLGCKPATAYTTAGLGDLVATGISSHSRNHMVGQEIGEQGATTLSSEGVISLPAILRFIGDGVKDLPLLSAILAVVIQKQSAREVFESLVHE